MSVTIEGTFREILKTFVDDPLKTSFKSPVLLKGYLMKFLKVLLNTPLKSTLKSPVIIEADKFILIIFTQRAIKDS